MARGRFGIGADVRTRSASTASRLAACRGICASRRRACAARRNGASTGIVSSPRPHARAATAEAVHSRIAAAVVACRSIYNAVNYRRFIVDKSCSNCKFYGSMVAVNKTILTLCRRRPPVVTGMLAPTGDGRVQFIEQTMWPQVRAEHWCGEFEPAIIEH